jgi:hypothetical protein
MLGIFVDHHGAGEGEHGRAQYHSERRLRIFFLSFNAGVKIIVTLHGMIACEHEFHALGVALLDDRLILPHAFEPFFDFPFAHHDVKSGHKARFRWIEGNLTFESGLQRSNQAFGALSGLTKSVL